MVFGRPATAAGDPPPGSGESDEVVLSVHGRSGGQIGYAALRLGCKGSLWGGLTISSELTLPDVRLLAWRSELQLAAAGLGHHGHHCLLTVSQDADARVRASLAAEFAEALRPLCADGLCEIVFTEDRALEPPVAAAGLRQCAVAATLAAVERAGLDRSRSTVAAHPSARAGSEVVQALASHGLTPLRRPEATLSAPADVLLLDGRPQRITIREAQAVRARILVALTPAIPTVAASRRLRDRRVSLVPDTVTGAGRFLAVELWRRGVEADAAARQAAAAVSRRLDLRDAAV